MEIFQTFGINWVLVIGQIINFLIILYILKRYLYKPLFNVLKKRQELAKESVKNAENSEKALESAKEHEKEIIQKARQIADDIIKEAKERSDEIVKQADVLAKERTDKMLQDAKVQIDLETAQAQKELNQYVLRLSLDMLKRTLNNVFTEKEQSEIIDKAMKEMQKLPN